MIVSKTLHLNNVLAKRGFIFIFLMLDKEGIHTETVADNLKVLRQRKIVELILDAWSRLPRESSPKSFKLSALNLALDGTKDAKIVCLRKRQPCEKGLEMLKTHASILSEVQLILLLQAITM